MIDTANGRIVCAMNGRVYASEGKLCRVLMWTSRRLDVAPIPGTNRTEYVQENLTAIDVAISADEVAYLADAFEPSRIIGERYAPTHFAHAEPARQH
jgi:diketogulonate reductase-like aldo/keto reductase